MTSRDEILKEICAQLSDIVQSDAALLMESNSETEALYSINAAIEKTIDDIMDILVDGRTKMVANLVRMYTVEDDPVIE